MTSVCPSDIDPLIWCSLPSDIQHELTQERLLRVNMDTKCDDIINTEQKAKKSKENTQSNLITNWTKLSPPSQRTIFNLTDSQSVEICKSNDKKNDLKSKTVHSPVKVMKQQHLTSNKKKIIEINEISTGKFVDLEFPATADSIDGRYIQKLLLSAPSR
jgi:hypothetical protein